MTAKTSLLAGASSHAMFHAPVAGASMLLRGPQVAYAPADEGGGGLSIEQAVAALDAHEPEESPAPEAQAAPEPVEDPEGAASAPEEAEDGAETPAEEPKAEAEAEPVVAAEPPKYWSQDAKERFAQLPPELQAVVLEQEGPREQASAKAKAEAAEISQKAQAEVAKVAQLAEALAERLPQWVQSFQSRWGANTPDWTAVANEHGVEQMVLLKTQFEQEAQQLAEANQAKAIAERQAREAQVQQEFAKLAEIAPDLADPETGPAKRTEISQFLVKQGISPEAVQNISAIEMALARDAKLWREAQAKAKAAPKTPPKPIPATKPLARGGAASGPADPQAKAALTAKRSFAQSRSIDAAVAYLNSLDD